MLVYVYAISGFFAGLAGLLLAGRTDSGFPLAGQNAELDAIAAVIIGGASFFGGRGTILGVLAGVLIMGLMRNGLNLNNISPFWQQILIGLVIIARRLHRRPAPACGGADVKLSIAMPGAVSAPGLRPFIGDELIPLGG